MNRYSTRSSTSAKVPLSHTETVGMELLEERKPNPKTQFWGNCQTPESWAPVLAWLKSYQFVIQAVVGKKINSCRWSANRAEGKI